MDLAAENAARAGLSLTPIWQVGDSATIPFGDATFDLVVSNDSLHHWEDPQRVFDEVARVLKPEGGCIVHDSKRLRHWWPWLFVKTISLTMPRDFRVHWWNFIRSSYTADEPRGILRGRSFATRVWRRTS